jgi:hypothetical protein
MSLTPVLVESFFGFTVVAQTAGLPYRRLPVGKALERDWSIRACRPAACDTADEAVCATPGQRCLPTRLFRINSKNLNPLDT